MPTSRERAVRRRAAVGLFAAIACGLLSRRFPLPGFLAEYTGDALCTVAVFFVLRIASPATVAARLAGLAFVISAIVEATQLLRWQWLVDLRATTFGALLLGQGFQWTDLLAYAVGAAVAVAIDRGTRPRG